jgi:hypothetical protein
MALHVFISYARKDQARATQLRADVHQLGHAVWFDQDVSGGHQWWSTILQQIRDCHVFVFVLSPYSVTSRACLAELNYAEVLRRPILPIMVRSVNPSTAPAVVANTQIIDYTNRTTDTVFSLLNGFNRMPRPGPLPQPLPPEPAIPTSYLNAYAERLGSPELTYSAQMELLAQLRAQLNNEEDQATILQLLVALRDRADLARALLPDLDEALAPGWRFDPEGDFERRWWGGRGFTSQVWKDGRAIDERGPEFAAVPAPAAGGAMPLIQPHQLATMPASQRPIAHPGRSKLPLVIGVGVAVAAVVTVLLVVLLGGSSSGSPDSVAQQFVNAMNARDGNTLASLACARVKDEVRDVSGLQGVSNIQLVGVNAGDSSGTFTISATFDGVNERHDLSLIKEDGEWRVCSL